MFLHSFLRNVDNYLTTTVNILLLHYLSLKVTVVAAQMKSVSNMLMLSLQLQAP